MSVDWIMENNRRFLEEHDGQRFDESKLPRRKTLIVSCMDPRLTNLVPEALGVRDGDVAFVRNAGGRITDPFGETMRSVLVAIFELGVTDVVFVGHTECGAQSISPESMIGHMKQRGITDETIDLLVRYVGLEKWLEGFVSSESAVLSSMKFLMDHPLHPKDVRIHGFVIDTHSGALTPVTMD